MKPDRHQQLALRTWYPRAHKLHEDMLPSIMGIAGESGELLDKLKKIMFKPGYDSIERNDELREELVDVWYYVRVLAYQLGMDIDEMTRRSAEKLLGGRHGWEDHGEEKNDERT